MGISSCGLEVIANTDKIGDLIASIETLQSDMQLVTERISKLQNSIETDECWKGNGKSECAYVLMLLAQYSAYLSGREISISDGICDNSALCAKSVTGTMGHMMKVLDYMKQFKDDMELFDKKTAVSIYPIDQI